jgi:type III restriction enzyme
MILDIRCEAHNLSDTKPFSWSRNLIPFPLECEKTIFNYVATYNNFERRFAEFLDNASDIRKFAALGTTEQGDSGTQLRVDYLKSTGAIGFYHPDFIAIQKKGQNEINWIIETKGRVWKDTEAKDEAITYWCNQMSVKTGHSWKFKRVNQKDFEKYRTNKLETLLKKI